MPGAAVKQFRALSFEEGSGLPKRHASFFIMWMIKNPVFLSERFSPAG
jgi:hypothetical protein